MTLMTDLQIQRAIKSGEVVIEPFDLLALQPVSVDLRLGASVVLPPGAFALASTLERVELPADVVGVVRDKSSLARRGVFMSHGLIDPGFRGHITLELVNHSAELVVLDARRFVAQMTLERLPEPVALPYGCKGLGSHYQDQGPDPTPARD